MRFRETFVSKESRYSLGIREESGLRFAASRSQIEWSTTRSSPRSATTSMGSLWKPKCGN